MNEDGQRQNTIMMQWSFY